ncbi:hypothetical protein [Arthrobacter sp. efr-133-R2A-63]|uniref:hypothetical protein n=1 Tax=Arthrobacter sp. efr-133-R2A-63 TaxID=3040278 RepID=UPI00254CF143|nr:hypothetical protein [Arthrobacter sp. efr-133-R2A-63]
MGFLKFIVAAYRESYAKGMVRLVLWVANFAGVLSLVGITVVIFKVSDLPTWLPYCGLAVVIVASLLLTLQGAYVLWDKASHLEPVADAVSGEVPDPHTVQGVGRPGARTTMRNITVRDNGGDGMRIQGDASLDIDGLRADGNAGHGVVVK